MKLEDEVVLVTGASAGIGLEIAKTLLANGATVAFAARSKAKLDEEVARTGSDRAIAVEMDVTDRASVEAGVALVFGRFGRIDVLVNNAGNAKEMSLWAAHDDAFTQNMFDVHVHGAERTIRAVLPSMRARASGTIVNFSSRSAGSRCRAPPRTPLRRRRSCRSPRRCGTSSRATESTSASTSLRIPAPSPA